MWYVIKRVIHLHDPLLLHSYLQHLPLIRATDISGWHDDNARWVVLCILLALFPGKRRIRYRYQWRTYQPYLSVLLPSLLVLALEFFGVCASYASRERSGGHRAPSCSVQKDRRYSLSRPHASFSVCKKVQKSVYNVGIGTCIGGKIRGFHVVHQITLTRQSQHHSIILPL